MHARFNHPALLEKYDETVRDGLSKVCNVNFDVISSTQLVLPAEMGGLGVSSASLLALPASLASAFGASDFLTTIFSETFEDVSFTKAFEKWLSLTNEQECPLDRGRGHFVTSHLGDNMASVTWATKVSTKWVDQIDQLTDIFKEVSIFVVWLGRFAPFAK